ncbi:hypothetical protein HK405_003109, partial [Cladochytrium tenue]
YHVRYARAAVDVRGQRVVPRPGSPLTERFDAGERDATAGGGLAGADAGGELAARMSAAEALEHPFLTAGDAAFGAREHRISSLKLFGLAQSEGRQLVAAEMEAVKDEVEEEDEEKNGEALAPAESNEAPRSCGANVKKSQLAGKPVDKGEEGGVVVEEETEDEAANTANPGRGRPLDAAVVVVAD